MYKVFGHQIKIWLQIIAFQGHQKRRTSSWKSVLNMTPNWCAFKSGPETSQCRLWAMKKNSQLCPSYGPILTIKEKTCLSQVVVSVIVSFFYSYCWLCLYQVVISCDHFHNCRWFFQWLIERSNCLSATRCAGKVRRSFRRQRYKNAGLNGTNAICEATEAWHRLTIYTACLQKGGSRPFASWYTKQQ